MPHFRVDDALHSHPKAQRAGDEALGMWALNDAWATVNDEDGIEFEADGQEIGRACLFCGMAEDLTLDHIIPWSHGGPDTIDNLRVLCRPCNSARGNRVDTHLNG